MTFSEDHAPKEQPFADERKLDDTNAQRSAIVGDVDGHWLITEIEKLRHSDHSVRTGKVMCFSFLVEGKEAVLSQLRNSDSVTAIEMPASSIVRKADGDSFDTWVFRVENGYSGADEEYIEVAYRELETGDYLLYLREYHPSRVSSR